MGKLAMRAIVAAGALALAIILAGATIGPFSVNQKAFYADTAWVAFVRPGLVITVTSAEAAQDGTISVAFSLTDPKGAPLDRNGIATPGTIGLNFIAAYIPQGERQYVDYITRSATGAVSGTVQQAAAESDGTFEVQGDGRYRYTFLTKAPTGFDRTTTHTIGIYGSRDLSEFDLGTDYASTTFNFVPDGSPVTVVRDVIRTQSCNRCHDQLSSHGGSRRGVDMCVLCHSPQTIDPDTGNSVDLKVMAHKIHMGEELPSVQAGKPYQIIGRNGAVSDYSTVVHPSDPRRCEVCHQQDSGATQATAYMTKPTRASCGACHDDVNFATGEGHAAGPQVSDNQCALCHQPQGELEFDASIKGAHTVPTDSASLSGLVFQIQKVDNGSAGQRPTVTFTVKDNKGAAIPLNSLNNLSFVMAGPSSDYGYTSFGSDVSTPGYVSESALSSAQCGQDGMCVYTFNHAVPAGAKGSFAIGIEGRRTETLLPGTTEQMDVRYGGDNKVTYFSVDGSAVAPRRSVVQIANCNQCHFELAFHGSNRNEVEMCVLCHNPSNTSSDTPPKGINFNLIIHRIHSGEVRYPQMSPQGSPGDTRNCAACHANGSQSSSGGINDVLDPQGFINPVKPNTSACIGCHVSKEVSSHALANTTPLGESCSVCHGANSAFSVDKSHAQY
jgi:OmcA/MtrC family decaheme c-type cytochrome